MNPNLETNAPKPPSGPPDRLRVRWSGSFLILFERRPFAKLLLTRYLPAILIGYPAFLALASFLQWSWLPGWLHLWTPVVDILRDIFPIFDTYERLLLAEGLGHSVPVFHHVLAFGWLVCVPIYLFLFVTVCRLHRDEWSRIVTAIPQDLFFLQFLVSTIFALYLVHWAVFGSNILHRYEESLVGIGILFGAIGIFGLAAEVSLGAMIMALRLEAARENCERSQDGPEQHPESREFR